MVLDRFKILALTHKSSSLEDIGKFFINEENIETRLIALKAEMGWDELVYLATCNRVEFLISTKDEITNEHLNKFFKSFNSQWSNSQIEYFLPQIDVFKGKDAVLHMFGVASSLDSMVVGEREIITQVRNAYDKSNSLGIAGDLMRVVIKKTIQIAKEVYSNTNIAKNPVSVVSLAYRKLKDLKVDNNARILIVGAGKTNTSMAKYLKKHGFSDMTVFSRTLSNANLLADDLNGTAQGLNELSTYENGFDVVISCTGSSEYIITQDVYKSLVGDDKAQKIVIDLAIPNDFDSAILDDFKVNLIAINNLKDIAKENLKQREGELKDCKKIVLAGLEEFVDLLKEREVELAMRKIPEKVKEISDTAMNSVFAKDLQKLDSSSRETLEKVLAYVEKKYISVPMKMAKEVLLAKKPK